MHEATPKTADVHQVAGENEKSNRHQRKLVETGKQPFGDHGHRHPAFDPIGRPTAAQRTKKIGRPRQSSSTAETRNTPVIA